MPFTRRANLLRDEAKPGPRHRGIEQELNERIADFEGEGKLLEAQRIEQRAMYDLEMLREIGFTSGIENYSRHMDQRAPGYGPGLLLDYFPADYLMVIDESHMTIPQVRGMWAGDRSRKDLGRLRFPAAKRARQPAAQFR